MGFQLTVRISGIRVRVFEVRVRVLEVREWGFEYRLTVRLRVLGRMRTRDGAAVERAGAAMCTYMNTHKAMHTYIHSPCLCACVCMWAVRRYIERLAHVRFVELALLRRPNLNAPSWRGGGDLRPGERLGYSTVL